MTNQRDKIASGIDLSITPSAAYEILIAAFLGFLVILVLGLLMIWAEGFSIFIRSVVSYSWPETDCEITTSAIKDIQREGLLGKDFCIKVQYRYRVAGRPHTSLQFALKQRTFEDYAEVQRMALRYPPGGKAVCYVNPSDPGEAVLVRDSLGGGFLFPLVLVLIGSGGMFFIVRRLIRHRQQASTVPNSAEERISTKGYAEKQRPAGGLGCIAILLLLALGAAFAFFHNLGVLSQVLYARSWQQTPCVIVSSEVRSIQTRGGPMYGLNILYAYQVSGREYRANRHDFKRSHYSEFGGYDHWADLAASYRRGTRTLCFVNPRDRTDAVLERGFKTSMFLEPFISLLLLGLTVYFLRKDVNGTLWVSSGSGSLRST